MSTHDLELQQSRCQSGVKASVTCVVSDQERFYTHADKSRFQNVSEQEKLHPGPIHNNQDLENTTTASPPLVPLKGQEKSSKDLQISQIILLRPKKNSSLTSEGREPARFTSTVSISLPTRRNKKVTVEDKTLQTNLSSTLEAVKNTANQQHTELRDVFSSTEQCGESAEVLFKDGDGQKSPFNEDTINNGHNTPDHGQNTGIQHNLGVYNLIKIIPKDSQRHSTQLVHEVQTEVNQQSGASDCRENAPTTPQNQKDLDNSVLNAGIDSKLFSQNSEELNQVLSLTDFPAAHSENTTKPESSLINPASTMLTSTLVSVLAPPWSGRLRRPKQGGSEAEHEPQDGGQNVNPSTFFQQDRQQQLFLPSQRQRSLVLDKNMQLTPGCSYSPDWQKENNSPNITATIQPKTPILKSSSVGTMYNTTERHSFPTPMDTRQVPNSSHSGYRISKTGDEHEPFKSLSSKPTTSSLLLSLRRSHLRSSSADPTQTETQITSSVRSLTLPNRIVLKTPSFAQSVGRDDQITKYPDTPTKTEETPVGQFPFSPRIKSRVPLHTPLFLKKTETDISKTLEAPIARVEEERSKSKTDQLGVIKTQHNSYLVLLRTYSSTEDLDPVEKRTDNNTKLQYPKVTKQQTSPDATITPKDSTNFNVQQTGFNVRNLKSQSTQNITTINSSVTSTFTDRLSFSPRKDSSVDGISPTNLRQTYWDSKKHSNSSQSSMDLSSPLSPARPLRSVRVPSIYSYLRESSPSPTSHIQRTETSYANQDGASTLYSDKQMLPSRFSFDFNPSLPQVQALQKSSYDSCTRIAPAQSLPPDFGRKSAPRLSTSPYSSLISSRPALNNTLHGLSSPHSSKTHTRSTSYDTVTSHADHKSSPSPCTNSTRRQLASPDNEQKRPVQAYTSVPDNHRPAQPCLSQNAPDTSFVMESQSANIIPHPSQPSTGSNNFPQQERYGLIGLRPKHKLSEKEKFLLPNKHKVESESPLKAEKETTAVHMHERLQETQSPNSKKGLFASRGKKDSGFSSSSLPDKEVVSPQYLKTKRHSPVFKTSSRIDQMLNRLKLTFGVKRSDSTLDAITKKNKNTTLQPSDNETFEKPKTEEEPCSDSQPFESLPTNKSSLHSLSPLTLRTSEPTLNKDGQHRSNTEITYTGCMWEVPNSSLIVSKASFVSLSPRTIKKSESTLNAEWQNKSITVNKQNGSGCTWEGPISSLTTDKACSTSFRSLSPLTLQKSPENKPNVDQQKRHSDENGNRSYRRSFSPHRLKAESMNRSATLPHYKKSSVGPPSPFYLFDFDSEDNQNDNVFYSPVSKKTNSLCESDDFSPLSSSKSPVQQNLLGSRLSSSCADLKYGLQNKRSYSVSSVVSSRPSGPGRISTSSTSDLSSLDDFVPKGSYTVVDSPMSRCQSPTYDTKSATGEQFQIGYTDDRFEHDYADPTPPPSPTLSSSPRRISQAPAVSSPMRTSPENLSSPRGVLPSRSYTTILAVFEESGSDTTTDDEYYLGNGDDDELETEL